MENYIEKNMIAITRRNGIKATIQGLKDIKEFLFTPCIFSPDLDDIKDKKPLFDEAIFILTHLLNDNQVSHRVSKQLTIEDEMLARYQEEQIIVNKSKDNL